MELTKLPESQQQFLYPLVKLKGEASLYNLSNLGNVFGLLSEAYSDFAARVRKIAQVANEGYKSASRGFSNPRACEALLLVRGKVADADAVVISATSEQSGLLRTWESLQSLLERLSANYSNVASVLNVSVVNPIDAFAKDFQSLGVSRTRGVALQAARRGSFGLGAIDGFIPNLEALKRTSKYSHSHHRKLIDAVLKGHKELQQCVFSEQNLDNYSSDKLVVKAANKTVKAKLALSKSIQALFEAAPEIKEQYSTQTLQNVAGNSAAATSDNGSHEKASNELLDVQSACQYQQRFCELELQRLALVSSCMQLFIETLVESEKSNFAQMQHLWASIGKYSPNDDYREFESLILGCRVQFASKHARALNDEIYRLESLEKLLKKDLEVDKDENAYDFDDYNCPTPIDLELDSNDSLLDDGVTAVAATGRGTTVTDEKPSVASGTLEKEGALLSSPVGYVTGAPEEVENVTKEWSLKIISLMLQLYNTCNVEPIDWQRNNVSTVEDLDDFSKYPFYIDAQTETKVENHAGVFSYNLDDDIGASGWDILAFETILLARGYMSTFLNHPDLMVVDDANVENVELREYLLANMGIVQQIVSKLRNLADAFRSRINLSTRNNLVLDVVLRPRETFDYGYPLVGGCHFMDVRFRLLLLLDTFHKHDVYIYTDEYVADATSVNNPARSFDTNQDAMCKHAAKRLYDCEEFYQWISRQLHLIWLTLVQKLARILHKMPNLPKGLDHQAWNRAIHSSNPSRALGVAFVYPKHAELQSNCNALMECITDSLARVNELKHLAREKNWGNENKGLFAKQLVQRVLECMTRAQVLDDDLLVGVGADADFGGEKSASEGVAPNQGSGTCAPKSRHRPEPSQSLKPNPDSPDTAYSIEDNLSNFKCNRAIMPGDYCTDMRIYSSPDISVYTDLSRCSSLSCFSSCRSGRNGVYFGTNTERFGGPNPQNRFLHTGPETRKLSKTWSLEMPVVMRLVDSLHQAVTSCRLAGSQVPSHFQLVVFIGHLLQFGEALNFKLLKSQSTANTKAQIPLLAHSVLSSSSLWYSKFGSSSNHVGAELIKTVDAHVPYKSLKLKDLGFVPGIMAIDRSNTKATSDLVKQMVAMIQVPWNIQRLPIGLESINLYMLYDLNMLADIPQKGKREQNAHMDPMQYIEALLKQYSSIEFSNVDVCTSLNSSNIEGCTSETLINVKANVKKGASAVLFDVDCKERGVLEDCNENVDVDGDGYDDDKKIPNDESVRGPFGYNNNNKRAGNEMIKMAMFQIQGMHLYRVGARVHGILSDIIRHICPRGFNLYKMLSAAPNIRGLLRPSEHENAILIILYQRLATAKFRLDILNLLSDPEQRIEADAIRWILILNVLLHRALYADLNSLTNPNVPILDVPGLWEIPRPEHGPDVKLTSVFKSLVKANATRIFDKIIKKVYGKQAEVSSDNGILLNASKSGMRFSNASKIEISKVVQVLTLCLGAARCQIYTSTMQWELVIPEFYPTTVLQAFVACIEPYIKGVIDGGTIHTIGQLLPTLWKFVLFHRELEASRLVKNPPADGGSLEKLLLATMFFKYTRNRAVDWYGTFSIEFERFLEKCTLDLVTHTLQFTDVITRAFAKDNLKPCGQGALHSAATIDLLCVLQYSLRATFGVSAPAPWLIQPFTLACDSILACYSKAAEDYYRKALLDKIQTIIMATCPELAKAKWYNEPSSLGEPTPRLEELLSANELELVSMQSSVHDDLLLCCVNTTVISGKATGGYEKASQPDRTSKKDEASLSSPMSTIVDVPNDVGSDRQEEDVADSSPLVRRRRLFKGTNTTHAVEEVSHLIEQYKSALSKAPVLKDLVLVWNLEFLIKQIIVAPDEILGYYYSQLRERDEDYVNLHKHIGTMLSHGDVSGFFCFEPRDLPNFSHSKQHANIIWAAQRLLQDDAQVRTKKHLTLLMWKLALVDLHAEFFQKLYSPNIAGGISLTQIFKRLAKTIFPLIQEMPSKQRSSAMEALLYVTTSIVVWLLSNLRARGYNFSKADVRVLEADVALLESYAHVSNIKDLKIGTIILQALKPTHQAH